jgi:hypothetical protein
VKFVTETDYVRRDSNCNTINPSFIGIIELRITECGKVLFTFGDRQLEIGNVELGEWTTFYYSSALNAVYMSLANNDDTVFIDKSLPNNALVGGEEWATQLRIINDELSTFWTGSVDGKYDFFHGTIGAVLYGSYEPFILADSTNGIFFNYSETYASQSA